jgi:hypothetical protein
MLNIETNQARKGFFIVRFLTIFYVVIIYNKQLEVII